jgi:ankyrin repeat protein
MSLLLAAGASPVALDNVSRLSVKTCLIIPQVGATPLHRACYHGKISVEVIQLLYDAGADFLRKDRVRRHSLGSSSRPLLS